MPGVLLTRRSTALRVMALALCLLSALTATACAEPRLVGAPMQPVTSTDVPAPSLTGRPSPAGRPAPAPSKSHKPPRVINLTCSQTTRQKEVETALAAIGTYGSVTVDGYQTSADCETIKKFQRRMGIIPANGRADSTTASVAKRIAATKTSACNAGTATMACIDLTHQTFYIMSGGQVALGPTVTRTGMAGFATPAGSFPITARSLKSWSNPYQVWLPYWQHFYKGMGLHETTTYIHIMGIGSHGCVNLLHADAVKAYSLLGYGSIVHSYGRRPGT